MDHTAASGTCVSCHNGSTATGKSAQHIQSSTNCDSCHVTTGWTQVNVDHSAVSGSCDYCHNGSTATGKPSNHVQTSAQCEVCHSTLAWLPASFDHSNAAGSCSNCHNGTTATGKGSGHFTTSLQCDDCHSTSRWTSIRFTHTGGNYPGDHRSQVGCLDCHRGNSQNPTWRNSAYQPDCAGCHAGDFKSGPHKKIKDGTKYTVSELRNCAGSCHIYTDSSLTTIDKTRNRKHRPNGEF